MVDETNVPVVQDDLASLLPAANSTSIVEELGDEANWLPYLTLVQSSSVLAKPPHSITQGHLALKYGKSDVHDLGEAIDVFICDFRPRAMFSNRQTGKIDVVYDHTSEKFQEFQKRANDKTRGYFWGYEFLFYHGETGKFMTFFCNNPTLRRVAKTTLIAYLRKAATLKSDPIDNDEYSWWGLNVKPCTTPFAVPPDIAEMTEQIKNFQNTEEVSAPWDDEEPVEVDSTAETRER